MGVVFVSYFVVAMIIELTGNLIYSEFPLVS